MNISQAINDGLRAIANEIKVNRESNQRDKLEGYLTDEEKIRMMKLDLYRVNRCRFYTDSDVKHMEQLRKTISLLSNEVERKNDRENSLVTILNEGIKTFIGLGGLAVVGSYAVMMTGVCTHVNSQFCRNARVIPYTIERYFFDEPSLVNPDKFNVNIDQSK